VLTFFGKHGARHVQTFEDGDAAHMMRPSAHELTSAAR